jgi:ATP-binding cassette subfamily B protein
MKGKFTPPKQPSLWPLLKPYRKTIVLLVALTILGNAVGLAIPQLIARAIDAYAAGDFRMKIVIIEFVAVSVGVFLFAYLQNVVQTYASERVGRDLRTKLIAKLSRQSTLFVDRATPSKLLTNLTADVDSIKVYVAQAISSFISSGVIIVGVSVLLLLTDWKLALAVLAVLPIIGVTFFTTFGRVRVLFMKSREIIDRLNKVINESILGAALIRVLHSQKNEQAKFIGANTDARSLGMKILGLFAAMIPIIMFVSNLTMLIILTLGGHFVITGEMTMGQFAAFTSYVVLLIFPILILGFISNLIAQASASYARIEGVLSAPDEPQGGELKATLRGDVEVKGVALAYGEKPALKDVSFSAKAGTKTAIIGPTAAGKTTLMYLLTGLSRPDAGVVEFDGRPIADYDSENLHRQIGFVFQDSVLFNMSLRQNIAFSETVTDDSLKKAIEAAELHDFVASLPNGLDTVVSERGTSLSGGQKQRIMLARALALDPKVLMLDDFTARVDGQTERKILANLERLYPHLTLISVTQKLAAVEKYDQILLLMEGELLAKGTHDQLMASSPEYVQIHESQQSTDQYELRA